MAELHQTLPFLSTPLPMPWVRLAGIAGPRFQVSPLWFLDMGLLGLESGQAALPHHWSQAIGQRINLEKKKNALPPQSTHTMAALCPPLMPLEHPCDG